MKRLRAIAIIGVLALVAAACVADPEPTTTTVAPPGPTTTDGGQPSTTAGGGDNPLAEWGEDPTAADPALVEEALGPVTPSDPDSWNIVLASIARAHQDLAAAGIDIDVAIECWSQPECDTGTGGPLVMGYADGGGNDVNVWRAVSHMEAVLQALTYPEIGTIVSQAADFSTDLAVHVSQFRFLIQRDVDFIVGYPDVGVGLADAVKEATAAGIPYIPFSAGYVGLPDQEGAAIPGVDYTAVVGEDLCALGESLAGVLTDNLQSGDKVALLGGTPGNGLSLGWQRCAVTSLGGLDLVNPPANPDSTTGDTSWYPFPAPFPNIPDTIRGLLTTNEDIRGWAYEYADGIWFGLQIYEDLGIPVTNLTVALRTDEQNLFCDWVERAEPTYNIYYSAGGNFQSRTAVTAAMMVLKGAEVPAEIVVPHVMRQVTADDCDPDAPNASVSTTSLIPAEVLEAMYPSG
ncbi:MAG: substrate-binding domain-containing protein [Acidimicrobiia bacterium]|nr:substrate-binding domain-containing protein [Acidimicrobiia bacterium]